MDLKRVLLQLRRRSIESARLTFAVVAFVRGTRSSVGLGAGEKDLRTPSSGRAVRYGKYGLECIPCVVSRTPKVSDTTVCSRATTQGLRTFGPQTRKRGFSATSYADRRREESFMVHLSPRHIQRQGFIHAVSSQVIAKANNCTTLKAGRLPHNPSANEAQTFPLHHDTRSA